MSAIIWSEALALQQPRMDDTHREFVELLSQVEEMLDGPDEALAQCLDDFLLHTELHFAQEDRWMAELGFAAVNCHTHQHAQVLQVVREVQRRLRESNDRPTVRLLVQELSQWFPTHAQHMDAALAQTMAERGYDPEAVKTEEAVAA